MYIHECCDLVLSTKDALMLTGNPTEKETEQITLQWQSSLFNAHYDIQR